MKKYLILLSLWIYSFGMLHGQSDVILLVDQSEAINVTNQSYYLEDLEGTLDPAVVVNGEHDDQFQRQTGDNNSFGNVHTSYWHKLTIDIDDEDGQSWYLIADNHHLDSVHFFMSDSLKGFSVNKTGRLVPFDDRAVEFNTFAHEIDPKNGNNQVIYVRVTCYYLNYPFKIMREDAMLEEYSRRKFRFGIITGFLMMIAFYNLFIYFTVRDKKYLFYILYVFLTMLSINTTYGNLDELWQGNFAIMNYISPAILMASGIASYLFTYHFLKIKEYLPWGVKIIVFVLIPAWIAGIVFSLTNNDLYVSLINQIMTLVAIPILLMFGILIYRKGYKPARYFILAQLFLMISFMINASASLGIISFSSSIENLFAYGAGFEILFFSFALADMINEYKKEKQEAERHLVSSLKENEKLVKNQNKLLEKKVKERTNELEVEKEKSDNLLLNILPSQIADELKMSGKTEAKHFAESTIMFTDFVNFTGISAKMDPIELVREVNRCFTAFDHIMEEHRLEKIKTIGDAYLAVCGLPTEDPEHAQNVVNAAFAIRNFVAEHNKKDGIFEIRIGIHTGPLVAGVVGVKKFAFDIWGDSVNIASRIEEASESGKINISQSTYDLVKEHCECEYRGKIPIKNRGEVTMYFIEPKT